MSKGFFLTMVLLGLLGMGGIASTALWYLHGKEMVAKHEKNIAKQGEFLSKQIESFSKSSEAKSLLPKVFSKNPPSLRIKEAISKALTPGTKTTLLKMAGAYPQIIFTNDNRVRLNQGDRLLPAIEKVAFAASQKFNSEQKLSHIEINEKLFYLRTFTTIYAKNRKQLMAMAQIKLPPKNIGDDVIAYIAWRVGTLLAVLATIAILVYFLILAKIE